MGVTTKIWGPSAWKMLQGLAEQFDLVFEIPTQYAFFARVFNTIPCIHCRGCMQTYMAHKKKHQNNRSLIYHVHTAVSTKLLKQEIYFSIKNDVHLESVFVHWRGYQPHYRDVMKSRIRHTEEFYVNMINFLYYAATDYEHDRKIAFLALYEFLFDMLYGEKINIYAIVNIQRLLHTNIFHRIHTIYSIEHILYEKKKINVFPLPFGHRLIMCRTSITSCTGLTTLDKKPIDTKTMETKTIDTTYHSKTFRMQPEWNIVPGDIIYHGTPK
jgi:hypothetical protein